MYLDVDKRTWWIYLEEDLRELMRESTLLLATAKKWDEKFHDYSFIVFPAAKAYEGFLKKLFLDLKFISEDDYYGKRFRIGRALNPQLEKRYRRESVYDKLQEFCSGEQLPKRLWETWKEARNILFHWFPNEKNAVTLKEAEERVIMIIEAIDEAFKTCRV